MSDPEFSAYALDARAVRRAFDKACDGYDAAAVLQAEIRSLLLQRLELTKLAPAVVLDAGAGTGHASRALKRRYPEACVIAADSSAGMLRMARSQQSWWRTFERLGADALSLPLADGCVDMILSNLLLPFVDPERLFAEFRRVLKPGGFLTFTTYGPDTLRELRQAWSTVDTHTHVGQFYDMHDLGDAMVRAGFAQPVMDVDRYTLEYTEVRKLALDLKAVGAHNVTAGRSRGLTGRAAFGAMQSAYERYRRDGRLPATYEIVFGQAWGPPPRPQGHGETVVSLDEVKQQLGLRRRPGDPDRAP